MLRATNLDQNLIPKHHLDIVTEVREDDGRQVWVRGAVDVELKVLHDFG